jgi:hypothetical protein
VSRGTWGPLRNPRAFRIRDFHPLRSAFPDRSPTRQNPAVERPATPAPLRTPVWALPRSLAATTGITVVFFSSGYLDVSVPPVCLPSPISFSHGCHPMTGGGFPHSDTPGSLPAYGSPGHFGVRPVLHRHLAPRHPPCALPTLTCLCLLPSRSRERGPAIPFALQFSRIRNPRPQRRAFPQNQTRQRTLRRRFPAAPLLLRKEVIQPHLPIRLPCYDFTPIIGPTFGGWLPSGLPHRLRVLPTLVV